MEKLELIETKSCKAGKVCHEVARSVRSAFLLARSTAELEELQKIYTFLLAEGQISS